jgi:hypothetical protein
MITVSHLNNRIAKLDILRDSVIVAMLCKESKTPFLRYLLLSNPNPTNSKSKPIMRLPASLEWMGSNGKIPIYPEILPQRSDGLVIVLNTQSNCQARLCQLGAISTFRNYLVQSQNIINRSGDPQYRETTPISLPQGIQGIYLKSWTGGASSVPGAAVLWEQDSQGFVSTKVE